MELILLQVTLLLIQHKVVLFLPNHRQSRQISYTAVGKGKPFCIVQLQTYSEERSSISKGKINPTMYGTCQSGTTVNLFCCNFTVICKRDCSILSIFLGEMKNPKAEKTQFSATLSHFLMMLRFPFYSLV